MAAARATLLRDPAWAAPLLWRSELRNALALYLRKGELSLRQATTVQDTAEELLLGREHHVASHDVLAMADAVALTALGIDAADVYVTKRCTGHGRYGSSGSTAQFD